MRSLDISIPTERSLKISLGLMNIEKGFLPFILDKDPCRVALILHVYAYSVQLEERLEWSVVPSSKLWGLYVAKIRQLIQIRKSTSCSLGYTSIVFVVARREDMNQDQYISPCKEVERPLAELLMESIRWELVQKSCMPQRYSR